MLEGEGREEEDRWVGGREGKGDMLLRKECHDGTLGIYCVRRGDDVPSSIPFSSIHPSIHRQPDISHPSTHSIHWLTLPF